MARGSSPGSRYVPTWTSVGDDGSGIIEIGRRMGSGWVRSNKVLEECAKGCENEVMESSTGAEGGAHNEVVDEFRLSSSLGS